MEFGTRAQRQPELNMDETEYKELMGRLDAMTKRMDASEERTRVADEEDEKKRKDESEDEKCAAEKARADESEEERAKDTKEEDKERKDKKRADAESEEEHKEAEPESERKEGGKKEAETKKRDDESEKDKTSEEDKKRADNQRSAMTRRIDEVDANVRDLLKPLSSEDRDELASIQSRADGLAQTLGERISPPLFGERPINYRKRLAAKFQKFSKGTEKIRIDELDGPSFGVIEERIYNDAQIVAPSLMRKGVLSENIRADASGRRIKTYTGDPKAWLGDFTTKPLNVRINKDFGSNR